LSNLTHLIEFGRGFSAAFTSCCFIIISKQRIYICAQTLKMAAERAFLFNDLTLPSRGVPLRRHASGHPLRLVERLYRSHEETAAGLHSACCRNERGQSSARSNPSAFELLVLPRRHRPQISDVCLFVKNAHQQYSMANTPSLPKNKIVASIG